MSKGKGIRKCSYEYIRKNIFEPYINTELHFHVEQLPQRAFGKDAYIITAYYEGKYYTLCMGKSLKGYKGDIIHLQYDGYCYGTGDYRLVSDRHGLICKIKQTNLVEKLADVDKERSRKEVYNANNMSFDIRFGLTPNDWEMRLDIDIAHLELVEIGIREEILRKRGK